jgi:hypothetical protein
MVVSSKRVTCVGVTAHLQLAELALDQQAAESVREATALALARLSLLNKYKVTDVIAALCRCLLTDSKQVVRLYLADTPSCVHRRTYMQ